VMACVALDAALGPVTGRAAVHRLEARLAGGVARARARVGDTDASAIVRPGSTASVTRNVVGDALTATELLSAGTRWDARDAVARYRTTHRSFARGARRRSTASDVTVTHARSRARMVSRLAAQRAVTVLTQGGAVWIGRTAHAARPAPGRVVVRHAALFTAVMTWPAFERTGGAGAHRSHRAGGQGTDLAIAPARILALERDAQAVALVGARAACALAGLRFGDAASGTELLSAGARSATLTVVAGRAAARRWNTRFARGAAVLGAVVTDTSAVTVVVVLVTRDRACAIDATRAAMLRARANAAVRATRARIRVAHAPAVTRVVPGQTLEPALLTVTGRLRRAGRDWARRARRPACVHAECGRAESTTLVGACGTPGPTGRGLVDARSRAQSLAGWARPAALPAVTGGFATDWRLARRAGYPACPHVSVQDAASRAEVASRRADEPGLGEVAPTPGRADIGAAAAGARANDVVRRRGRAREERDQQPEQPRESHQTFPIPFQRRCDANARRTRSLRRNPTTGFQPIRSTPAFRSRQ
jgi:hypothetical protein